jgi:hypothetical protein
MRWLKSVFNFYINSSLHVALAVVSLVLITYKEFGVEVDINKLIFVLFGTVTGYNFVKYAGVAKLHHLSLAKNLRVIQIFSFLIFIGLVVTTFYQSINTLIVSAIMGVFTFLYVLPFLQSENSLRSISGLKIFVIAFVWAGVTVLIPLVDIIAILQLDVALTFIQRFCLVIALIMPFEIRDLQYDDQSLGTLPQKFGVKGAKMIGQSSVVIMLMLEFLKVETLAGHVISMLSVTILALCAIIFATRQQNKYYASFWVEGIPIIWVCILMLLS